jgi:hypothetical protein
MADPPLSWHVEADEARRRPRSGPAPVDVEGPEGGRDWRPLALAAGAILLALAGLVWRVGQQTEQERAALTTALGDHVVAEAKAMAARRVQDAPALLDPAPPPAWAQRYLRLFAAESVNPFNELCGVYGVGWHPNTARPAVTLVDLQESPAGRRAVVRLTWSTGSAATELRAYREVAGAWRRTPLTDAEMTRGAIREVQVGPWHVSGPDGDVRALTTAEGPGVDFALLDQRVQAVRAALVVDRPGDAWVASPSADGRIVVRPTELEMPVIEGPEPYVVVNSPDMALVNPDGPLSAAALYRLALVTGAVNARYGEQAAAVPFGPFWALDDAESKAVRNRMREVLAGAWQSQFKPDEASAIPDLAEPAAYQSWQRGCISDDLLMQQLLATGRVASLAELIERLNLGGVAAFLTLSGQPDRPAFERWARAWATTPEP